MAQHFQTEFLSPSQISELTGLSAKTIIRCIEKGEIPATKLGGSWRIPVSWYESWSKPSD